MLQSTRNESSKFTESLTITFSASEQASEKTDQEVQQEIQSIFRQITASVTFLPMLDGNCTFNVLVYADQDSEVPLEWGDSDAKDIQDAEKVQLRSFSTSNHKVDTLVSYRYVFIADVITCLTCSNYI
jgi:mitotic spindle assembly checkpoint protein MAD2